MTEKWSKIAFFAFLRQWEHVRTFSLNPLAFLASALSGSFWTQVRMLCPRSPHSEHTLISLLLLIADFLLAAFGQFSVRCRFEPH